MIFFLNYNIHYRGFLFCNEYPLWHHELEFWRQTMGDRGPVKDWFTFLSTLLIILTFFSLENLSCPKQRILTVLLQITILQTFRFPMISTLQLYYLFFFLFFPYFILLILNNCFIFVIYLWQNKGFMNRVRVLNTTYIHSIGD